MNENIKNPIQSIIIDEHGIIRFKQNAIVKYLLDSHPTVKLHELAMMNFSKEDRQQFAQLIGYSVSSYGGLSYVDSDDRAIVNAMVNNTEVLSEDKIRIALLEKELKAIRDAFREPCAELFNVAIEDLED